MEAERAGYTMMEITRVTQGMEVRTADLERICAHRDPRAVEFACFLLHSSKADPELAAFRAIDGMFEDPPVRAVQRDTADAVREVALAALDLRLAQHIEQSIARSWAATESSALAP